MRFFHDIYEWYSTGYILLVTVSVFALASSFIDFLQVEYLFLVILLSYLPYFFAGVVIARKERTKSEKRQDLEQRTSDYSLWPSVSVLIPAWREKGTIEECLGRFLDSDYRGRLEIIVTAGGPDNTYAVCKQFSKDHPSARIRVLEQTPKEGKNTALQKGFKQSNGEIIVVHDADSYVETRYLTKLIKPLIRNKADVTVPIAMPYRNVGNRYLQAYFCTKRITEFAIDHNYFYTGQTSCAMKRSTLISIGGFDESLPMAVDLDLDMRLRQKGFKICNVVDLFLETNDPETIRKFWLKEIRWAKSLLIPKIRSRISTLHLIKEYLVVIFFIFTPPFYVLSRIWFPNVGIIFSIVWLLYVFYHLSKWLCKGVEVSVYTQQASWLKYIPTNFLLHILVKLAKLVAFITPGRISFKFKGPRKLD